MSSIGDVRSKIFRAAELLMSFQRRRQCATCVMFICTCGDRYFSHDNADVIGVRETPPAHSQQTIVSEHNKLTPTSSRSLRLQMGGEFFSRLTAGWQHGCSQGYPVLRSSLPNRRAWGEMGGDGKEIGEIMSAGQGSGTLWVKTRRVGGVRGCLP